MRENFRLNNETIDFRDENITLYNIIRKMKNGKLKFTKDISIDINRKLFLILRLSKGYPTRNIVALQDNNGNYTIYTTEELSSLMDFIENKFPIDDIYYKNMSDQGIVENISFIMHIIRPSEENKFDISIYYSN